jgi:hypothetical protein
MRVCCLVGVVVSEYVREDAPDEHWEPPEAVSAGVDHAIKKPMTLEMFDQRPRSVPSQQIWRVWIVDEYGADEVLCDLIGDRKGHCDHQRGPVGELRKDLLPQIPPNSE